MEERKSWPFGEVVAANSEFLTEDLAASGQRNGELFLVRSSPGLGAPCCTSPSRSTAREDRLPDSTPRGGIAACASADLSPVSRARPEPSRAAARPAVVCSSLCGRHAPSRRDRSWGTFLGALRSPADAKTGNAGPQNLPYWGMDPPTGLVNPDALSDPSSGAPGDWCLGGGASGLSGKALTLASCVTLTLTTPVFLSRPQIVHL